MALTDKFDQCLQEVLKVQNISKYRLTFPGKTGKFDGYLGDINFVTVVDDNSNQPLLHLAVKTSKQSQKLRSKTIIVTLYRREIFVYSQLFPAFKQLEEAEGVVEGFSNVPRYFGSKIYDDVEFLVLEDLKEAGYEMWPVTKPLTVEHTKLVLRAYAKYHALSFALRDQKPEEFERLVGTRKNLLGRIMEDNCFTSIVKKCFCERDLLEGFVDEAVLQKLESMRHKVDLIFTDEFNDDPEFSVIAHGDCWNNNFVYRYETDPQHGHKRTPVDVRILDWQCSTLLSPVNDLSYFLYCTSDRQQYLHFDELLAIYHNTLSEHLVKLGCCPDKLYPLSKLHEHWRKYSIFGFVLMPPVVKVVSGEDKEHLDLGELAENDMDLTAAFSMDLKDVDAYRRRVVDLIEHYVGLGYL